MQSQFFSRPTLLYYKEEEKHTDIYIYKSKEIVNNYQYHGNNAESEYGNGNILRQTRGSEMLLIA
jgi:hypothetical protein